MMAKSPLGPPRFHRTMSSCPHTCSTIVDVRASAPSIKREKCAKMRAREIDSGKVGESNKIVKKHVKK